MWRTKSIQTYIYGFNYSAIRNMLLICEYHHPVDVKKFRWSVVELIAMCLFNVGGSGGVGGDVILECSRRVWDFSGLQRHLVCTYIFYQKHLCQKMMRFFMSVTLTVHGR